MRQCDAWRFSRGAGYGIAVDIILPGLNAADMSPLAFVTGAGGAIGGHVVRLLAASGWRVAGVGHGNAPPGVAAWINGDVDGSNLGALAQSCGLPAGIVHLAGGSSVGPSLAAPAEDFNRSVLSTVKLLDWLRLNARQVPLVLASSAAVYGDRHSEPIAESAPRAPFSPYGYHKAMVEMAAECWAGNFALNVAIVRLFSVYGPGLRKQLIWEMCARLKAGEREIVLGGTGCEARDWLFIADAAAMLIAALDLASPAAPIFNGCTGMATNVADIARALIDAVDRSIALRFTGECRRGDPAYLVGRTELAAASGLRAGTSVQDGLARTLAAARKELLF
jgi:UDP-glucose 4-epimerase